MPECNCLGQTTIWLEMSEECKHKLNQHRKLPAPFMIYANVESLMTKMAGTELEQSMNNTERTRGHVACSYC